MMSYGIVGRVIVTAGLAGALVFATIGTASAADGAGVQQVAQAVPTAVAAPLNPPDCNEEFVNASAAMGGGALAGAAAGGPPGALAGAAGGGIVGGTSLAQCLQE